MVEDHTWDFVPLNATSPSTLKALLSLQSVPGEIRHRSVNDAVVSPRAQRAIEFVDSYKNRDLHLIQNNCWTFALMLYWHVLQSENEDKDNGRSA